MNSLKRVVAVILSLTLPAVPLADVGAPAGRYIQSRSTLQAGTTFYVSSGTVAGQMSVESLKFPDGTIQVSSAPVVGGDGTGDIDAVTAGYGLTGGGASGAVTLNLAPTTTSYIWNSASLQTGATAYPDFLRVGTQVAGNLAMGGNKITGLAAGSSNGDALRYEQLVGLYLPLAGGTLSGNVAMGGQKITGLGAATTAGDALRYEQVSPLWAYRRPVLFYASATAVNLETGINGTSGQAAILFPDGTLRTDSTTTRINFDITRNCALSGSAQSGLRATLSEAVNTWYALYAVKVTDSATNFVVVGDTLLPLQANYATLNTNFGTNGWVYLGMIRNGDNSGATGDILAFHQAGNMTQFRNQCLANAGINMPGTQLATTAGATSLVYTYAAGTGATQIPDNITMASFSCHSAASGTGAISHQGATIVTSYFIGSETGSRTVLTVFAPASNGMQISAAASVARAIHLSGFVDGALGVGANPLF